MQEKQPEYVKRQNLWEQPGLEALLNRLRGATPELNGADAESLYILLATGRPSRTNWRSVATKKLGVLDETELTKIRGELNSIYEKEPWLADYLKMYGSSSRYAYEVPTLEDYSKTMQSIEERRKFGISPKDMERVPYS